MDIFQRYEVPISVKMSSTLISVSSKDFKTDCISWYKLVFTSLMINEYGQQACLHNLVQYQVYCPINNCAKLYPSVSLMPIYLIHLFSRRISTANGATILSNCYKTILVAHCFIRQGGLQQLDNFRQLLMYNHC